MTHGATHLDAFLPFDTGALPRALHRFGPTFPLAIAEAYCAAYAPRRGIVLDPFARPASAADAAEAADRRAVARHPAGFGEWARRVIAAAPGPAELQAALAAARAHERDGASLVSAMRALYGSTCPTCRSRVVVEAFLWDRDAPVPARKAFRCRVCGRAARALLTEPVDEDDVERAVRADPEGAGRRAVLARFGGTPDARAFGESVVSLYTTRNVAAIERILAAIDGSAPAFAAGRAEPDAPSTFTRAQAFLRLAMLEPLVAGSRVNAVSGGVPALRLEKGRARRTTAAQHREVNVWLEFERSFRELTQLVSARPALGRGVAPLPDADGVPAEPADLVLFEAPTADLLGGWHAVAAALLAGEAEPLARGERSAGGRERVLHETRSALLEAHRASRHGSHAVVYVPHADAGTLGAVALAGTAAGYRLRHLVYQRDALAGVRGDRSAALCDFERQPLLVRDQAPASVALLEETMRAGVRAAIEARGEPIDTDRAAVAALEALAAANLLPSMVLARGGGVSELEVFLDHLRSALADAPKGGLVRVERSGEDAYWSQTAGAEHAPLDDRVEWAVYSLLSTIRESDTRSLLKRVYALFPGAQTPDREIVLRCVASYGLQDEAGRWRLRAGDALAARQYEQAELVADLVHLARRLGYRVWIGLHLQRRRALADLMTDVERRAHLPLIVRGPHDAVGELDCVWYERGMTFAWKIDWTARLHQTLVAIGEAIPDSERLFRFLVVPEERRDLIRLKFRRTPSLAGIAQQRGWRLMKYGPLRAFARQPEVDLYGLQPLMGLEPALEQGGHQLVFNW